MSVIWKSDSCSCSWTINQIENTEDWEGTPINTCAAHQTLEQTMSSNRYKNDVVNIINDTLGNSQDPEKYITFNFDENTDTFIFYLNGYSPEEKQIINDLDLNITIGN